MRERETSAPSLGDWVMVPREPTAGMLNAPLAPGSSITGARYESRRDLRPLIYRAMLAAGPPTAMAEAVASARAEGVREALEVCKKLTPPEDAYHSGRIWDEHRAAVGEVEEAIRALIPGGSSDV